MTPARTLVPLSSVLPLLALAALGEAAGWAIGVGSDALAAGWYGRGVLLSMVHALTLGTLTAAIVGVGWQVTTVVVAAGWSKTAERVIPWVNRGLLVGVPLVVFGIAAPGPLGAIGVGLVVISLVTRSGLVFGMLWRAEGRRAVRAWLVGAELSLCAGLVVAVGLWAGRQGHPVFDSVVGALRLHVGLLLGGWVGGWVVGAGALLLPMFAVAKEPSSGLVWLAGVVWFGGLWTSEDRLLWVGGVLVAVVLGGPLLRGLRSGPWSRQALFGIGVLGATPALLWLVPVDAALAAAILLGALPVLHGVAQRIVPFLVWNHRLPHLTAPPGLVSARLATAQAAASLGGGGLVVLGRLGLAGALGPGSWGEPAGRLGSALGLIGALLQSALLYGVWRKVVAVEAAAAARIWT